MYSESSIGRMFEVQKEGDLAFDFDEVEGKVLLLPDGPVKERLLSELEESESVEQRKNIFEKAANILRKRAEIEKRPFKGLVRDKNEVKVYEEDSLADIRDILNEIKNRAECHIGSGSTADVYISSRHPEYCCKLISGPDVYKFCNQISVECELMSKAAHISVNGVRSPKPIYYAMHEEFHVLVMERVYGVTVDQILAGTQKMPEKFDPKQFFVDLRAYVKELHSQGLYHRDLNRQNVMIDYATGKPRVIDFGKSIVLEGAGDQDPYLFLNREMGESFKYKDDVQGILAMEQAFIDLKKNSVKNK